MSSAKVAISIPDEVLRVARREVKAGRAKSLSALVSEAIDEKLRRDELAAILDAMDVEYGPPRAGEKAWARRLVRAPSSSTRAR